MLCMLACLVMPYNITEYKYIYSTFYPRQKEKKNSTTGDFCAPDFRKRNRRQQKRKKKTLNPYTQAQPSFSPFFPPSFFFCFSLR